MASCGISLNLSSLESKITANISAMLGIAGVVGLPYATSGLLVAVALANGNFLAAIQIMVPADALDGLWDGLRDEFAGAFSLADAPDTSAFLDNALDATFGADRVSDAAGYFDYATDAATSGGDSFFSKLADISTDFVSGASKFAKETGLDQLSGYIDIDVTDLAKTAIGLGGSWDSCDFGTAGIPNYFRDPATGTIKLLANYAPKLGDTSVAKSNSVWGLTASINKIFQTGKGSVQTQLNVALGDVISSGTNYSLDSISGSTNIDSRDISNMKQWMSDYVSPTYYQTMRTASDGSRYLATTTTNVNDVKSKISGVLASSENNLNVMLTF
jgi:hypothetical protein